MAKKQTKPASSWRNRITRTGEMPAGEFLANVRNWRTHPKAQREALRGVLSEVGWVTGVIINKTTGAVVDGHARIEEALKLGEQTPVPFIEVELSEDEEAKILASLDPISAMATADKEQLDKLLREVKTADAGLMQMLDELRDGAEGAALKDVDEGAASERGIGQTPMFKPVIAIEDVAAIEQAIAATGESNRGAAVTIIARYYLDHAKR